MVIMSLRKALKHWFSQGYIWLANFDLAAFYDTIPHELLIKTIAPHGGKSELTDFITDCLKPGVQIIGQFNIIMVFRKDRPLQTF